MPSAWFKEYARIADTGPGSLFERVFGCTLDDLDAYSGRWLRFDKT
jgi:hypothetical protein